MDSAEEYVGVVMGVSSRPGSFLEAARRKYGITRSVLVLHLGGRPGTAHVSLVQRVGAPGRL